MGDNDFLLRLQELTGQVEAWEGFDPSKWRDADDTEDEQTESSAAGETMNSNEAAAPDEDGFESDVSQDLILNVRHFSAEEILKTRGYKLSKARGVAADAPETPRTLQNLEKVKWKETGLKQGDISPNGLTFVPWRLVMEYPNMFIGKRNAERAVSLFTLAALHERNQVWDLFYIHQPPAAVKESKKGGPILFVLTNQFQHLLDIVNAILDIHLTIPPGNNADKFTMSFGLGNTPRPRFLGRSTSVDSFESLSKAIPAPHETDGLECATDIGKEQFLEMLAMVFHTQKKTQSDKNRHKRIQSHRLWGKSIKRVQRYLGLRQKSSDVTTLSAPQSLDLHSPIAFQFEDSVLFVAIDIEAYEFNQDLLTEIGIAVLDTNQTASVAPGEKGENWFPLIHARHLRVKENSWAVNSTHVRGCADYFDFGESEFIPKAKIISEIEAIMNRTVVDENGVAKKRPVVLVFHDTAADISYLVSLGYSIAEAENVVDIIDTQEMHQYALRDQNGRKLETVLHYLGLQYRYLHNAGNDAVYTMCAMLGLAIKARLASLRYAGGKKEKGHVSYADFVANEGWSSNGEDSDGGVAPLTQQKARW
ncbi:hypothetical protein B0H66DRAFT_207375 [Apodospora peruviana]|uniref:Gfd2/YDR514C-like C-terminal domain-containing protein n=1 Tax=Apodospora peruviana TaxID=516989 RepID=A0AAE0M7P3_9PEZI|nr:hypothetical protein B0H66DRAFT_207375 [Apodospora peruviana]